MEEINDKIEREQREEALTAKRMQAVGKQIPLEEKPKKRKVIKVGDATPEAPAPGLRVVQDPDTNCPRVCTNCHGRDVVTRRDLDPTKKVDAVIYCKTCGYNRMRRPFVWKTPPPERNAPCPCGSGKKYKKCCQGK